MADGHPSPVCWSSTAQNESACRHRALVGIDEADISCHGRDESGVTGHAGIGKFEMTKHHDVKVESAVFDFDNVCVVK